MPPAEPTPVDRWLNLARWSALGAALLMGAFSLIPPALDAGAANEGADINVTTEFYTVVDDGGGYITWDFSPAASAKLRRWVDTDENGQVDQPEMLAFESNIDARLEHGVLVLRNFEIAAVRVVEQRGFIGEDVNSTAPVHLKVIMNGRWARHDQDIPLVSGGTVLVVYPDLAPAERVRERTIIVAAGVSSFGGLSFETRTPRVPGGSLVVHEESYSGAELNSAVGTPDVRFERFSVLNSTPVLLVPLLLAYLLGVRQPRLEQEASRRPRFVPFHKLLSAGFLLLVVLYFAGIPGVALWIGGVSFAAGGLWSAYRIYPSEGSHADGPARRTPDGGRSARSLPDSSPGGATADAALALLGDAHRPVGRPASRGEWMSVPEGKENQADQGAAIPASPEGAPASGATQRSAGSHPLRDKETPAPPVRSRQPAVRQSHPKAEAPATQQEGDLSETGMSRSLVRCPRCKHQFEAVGLRPIQVSCPHCGRSGLLR